MLEQTITGPKELDTTLVNLNQTNNSLYSNSFPN